MYEIKEYDAFLSWGRSQIYIKFCLSSKNIAHPPLLIRIAASPDEICPFYAPQNSSMSQLPSCFFLMIEKKGMGKIELNLQEMEGSLKKEFGGLFWEYVDFHLIVKQNS